MMIWCWSMWLNLHTPMNNRVYSQQYIAERWRYIVAINFLFRFWFWWSSAQKHRKFNERDRCLLKIYIHTIFQTDVLFCCFALLYFSVSSVFNSGYIYVRDSFVFEIKFFLTHFFSVAGVFFSGSFILFGTLFNIRIDVHNDDPCWRWCARKRLTII